MFEQLALFTTHFQGDDFGLVFWMLAKVPDSKVLSSHLTLEDIDKKYFNKHFPFSLGFLDQNFL